MRMVEFLLAGPKGGTVLINPAHICKCVNVHQEDSNNEHDEGVWLHGAIYTTDGSVTLVNASFEQIEEALAKHEAKGR